MPNSAPNIISHLYNGLLRQSLRPLSGVIVLPRKYILIRRYNFPLLRILSRSAIAITHLVRSVMDEGNMASRAQDATPATGSKRKRTPEAKLYVVRVGHTPGIYHTYAECLDQVRGFKGAQCLSSSP